MSDSARPGRRVSDHFKQQQKKRDKEVRKQVVRETIEECSRALTRSDERYYLFVAHRCETVLVPILIGDHRSRHIFHHLDKELAGQPGWHFRAALKAFNENLVEGAKELFEYRKLPPRTFESGMHLVEEAFESLVTIAEWRGYIQSDMTDEAAVKGHKLTVGRILEPWERDSPDLIHAVDPQGHPPVSVIQGLPGFGKSTAIETEVEDRYASGKKIIDVVDLTELENGLYDVPQGQDNLRDIRGDFGLPVDFTETDEYPRPRMEVLCPLTPGLAEADVPFHTDTDETVVRPFTIPAAEIPRKALNMMLSHLTDVQQTYLDRAYQSVSQQDDWSLHDLSDAVLATDAQDGVKRRIYNTLASLQELGFIRTKECEYALDWEEIFRDAGTITVFTQSTVEDGAHKFMVLSYLIHSLYHERQQYHNLPPLAAVFRELHHVAPNDRTSRQDDREREIQRGMVAAFQELCSMHRHENVEVLADTQQVMGQINKRAREHVERVVTFRSQMGTLKPLFKDMVGLDGDRFEHMKTIARDFDTGQAAIIGYTGTSRSLEMPVEFAPPMSHHLDATSPYDDGWIARVRILQERDDLSDEELRPAPWDATLPEELEFEPLSVKEGRDKGPVERFADECLQEQSNGEIVFDELYETLEAFADEKDIDEELPPRNIFGQKLAAELSFDKEKKMEQGERDTIYHGLAFTAAGERFRPGA